MPAGSPSSAGQPTAGPSPAPTRPPSRECEHLLVGRSCIYSTNLDILFIIDGSSSIENWDDLKQQLATLIESNFPINSRMAVIEFSSSARIVANFDYSRTRSDLAALVLGLEQQGGATYTLQAFETGLREVWESTLNDTRRDRVTVLISDGQPTPFQEPCAVLPQYSESGISVVEIAYSSILECGTVLDSYAVAGAAETVSVVERLFITQYCYEYEVQTPFNGWYARTNRTLNEHPVYEDHRGYEIWFDEVWLMTHEEVGVMAEIKTADYELNRPATLVNWTFYSVGRNYETYIRVPIECRDAEPTAFPSVLLQTLHASLIAHCASTGKRAR